VKSEARGDAGWAGLTYLRWRVHMLLKEVLRTRKVLASSEKALFLWPLSCILCAHILVPILLGIYAHRHRESVNILCFGKLLADEKSACFYCLGKLSLLLVLVVSLRCSYPRLHTAGYIFTATESVNILWRTRKVLACIVW
jgi:hypothetical protein